MEKKKKPTSAKYFKYQFTKTLLGLAIAVLVLCALGIAVSVYRICAFGIHGFIEALQSPLLIAVCLFCIVTVVWILLKSQYVIDDTYYVTQFGWIKSKYLIKDVTALELNAETQKLTVYIGEEFSVLSLAKEWQDEFIAALRAVNPDVEFTF